MESRIFSSILNQLKSNNFKSNERITQNLISTTRSFCTTKTRVPKTNLYSKISPLGNPSINLSPELDKWIKDGKNISVAELQRIIRDLRKRKRFTQALQVSEWMSNKGICSLSSIDHAVRLDLIGRVRGLDSAESYFNNINDKDKTDKTYGALLNCYVRAKVTDKSLSHMEKMKKLGFASSPLSYNDLMCLYTNTGEYEKIPGLLNEMKKNGVNPDNFSYRICINSYGAKRDISGVEKILEEMENQPHIVMDWNTYAVVANFYIKASLTDKAVTFLKKSEEKIDRKKDELAYNHLIALYASLGNKAEIMRLWGVGASSKKYMNKDYITMMGALVKLGEFEEAEKLLKEWESSGNNFDLRVPNTLVLGYSEKGLVEKAEKMLDDLVKKGKVLTPNIWGIVASGYVQKKNMEKAVKCMKKCFSLLDGNEGWRPNPKIISKILKWAGDNCESKEVDAFVKLLKTVIPMNRDMYHALIKANVRKGKGTDELLKSMKADKIDENQETKIILTKQKVAA